MNEFETNRGDGSSPRSSFDSPDDGEFDGGEFDERESFDGPPPPDDPNDPLGARIVEPEEAEADERTRRFPCDHCGADLMYDVAAHTLACEFCGFRRDAIETDEPPTEHDYRERLERIAKARAERSGEVEDDRVEVSCEACGAKVIILPNEISASCAFCGTPRMREGAARAPLSASRLPVDALIPFGVQRTAAKANITAWIRGLWFAPNAFKRRGVNDQPRGVFVPAITFDAHTFTRYSGQRGEDYWVTVGSGKNRRRVRKTRWYPASGTFEAFFDDVLVPAAHGVNEEHVRTLVPWPIEGLVAFKPEFLAGFEARTHEVELPTAFQSAKTRMDQRLHARTCQEIGGDRQRVASMESTFDPIGYRHILLPVWILTERWRERTYTILVNAHTGEVTGERPWSAWKIAFAIIAGIIAALIVVGFVALSQGR